jgi:hypothetical protein
MSQALEACSRVLKKRAAHSHLSMRVPVIRLFSSKGWSGAIPPLISALTKDVLPDGPPARRAAIPWLFFALRALLWWEFLLDGAEQAGG